MKAITDGTTQEAIFLLTRGPDLDNNTKFQGPRIELADFAGAMQYAVDDQQSVRMRVRWLTTDHQIDRAIPHAVFAFELRAEPRLEITGTPRVELTKIVDDMGKEKAVQAARMGPTGWLPKTQMSSARSR